MAQIKALLAFLLLLALLPGWPMACCAQPGPALASTPSYLILDKPGLVKRIRFYPGETIRFQLREEPGRFKGRLESVSQHSIRVSGGEIPLRDIEKITHLKSGSWAGFARLTRSSLLSGSITLAVLGSINYFSRSYRQDPTLLKLSPVSLGLSFLMKPLYQRNYRLNANRRLRTI